MLVFLIVIFIGCNTAAAQEPGHEVFGLHLGMSEEAVHQRLREIATQKKEEKEEEEGGEQEVWILKRDPKFNYLLTRFNPEHRLIMITIVAQPQRVRYSDVASLDNATRATDGLNYSYKWKMRAREGIRPYMLVARGNSPEFLTSYTLYIAR